ncbi:MAG TPA: hypothetical protein P5514_04775 [Bacteroidales bacterium]|nr:hypothetical protein [Bacteroidales bacterium]HRX96235.1 hypothetical protein [Bacteroidales bacterium]
MKKRERKIKPEFPLIELLFIAFMLFIFAITTRQVLSGNEEYYLIYPIILLGLIFSYFFSNYRYKTLKRNGSDLLVKPMFKRTRVFNKSNTKGFEIYETYDYTGLIEQIRLYDLNGNKIVFARDSYKDYERLIRIIRTSGIVDLGTKEIQWRFKKQYSIIVAISFIPAMIMFLFLRVK